jgi:IstB-like ATP binding protein
MGYRSPDEPGASIFSQLVSARYGRGSVILTSNKSYGDWVRFSVIGSSRRRSLPVLLLCHGAPARTSWISNRTPLLSDGFSQSM